MDSKKIKLEIIKAAEIAVNELIKVAKEDLLKKDFENMSPDLAADKLKNAAASKKLAIFDAFEIISKIEAEESKLLESESPEKNMNNFAERRAK